MVNDYVKKINSYLDEYSFNDFSLLSGSSGQLINLSEQDITSALEQNKIENLFHETINQFNKQKEDSTYTYCDGFSGLGWVIEYLSKKEVLSCDINNTLVDFDSVLYEIGLETLKVGNYDFLHGAIGIGWYFLERNSNNIAKDKLSKIVSLLYENSIQINGLRYWENKKNIDPCANFGLAHGMPSIIIFLSNCYKQGIEKEKTFHMINEAIRFINAYQLKNELSLYPINSISKRPSRLAWCYGDLGVGLSLWTAGKNLGVKSFQEQAYDVFKFSAKRKNMYENNVIDAGICHGTSGIALLFYRFYLETDDSFFYKMALYWIDKTRELGDKESGLEGFKSYRGHNHWELDTSLIDGLVGIALTGHTILNKRSSNWDRCLLLS